VWRGIQGRLTTSPEHIGRTSRRSLQRTGIMQKIAIALRHRRRPAKGGAGARSLAPLWLATILLAPCERVLLQQRRTK